MPFKSKIGSFFILCVAVALPPFLSASNAHSATVIRDTEIENTIRAYSAPLLAAAGLEDEAFNIHIVRDRDLNAFVTRGQRLFITTGLLRRSVHAGQILGVMSHEIGHIAGGHLARLHGALDKAGTVAFVTQILGLAAGILARDPGAAVAIAGGGNQVAERTFLNFSRGQEQAADQAGVRYMDKAGFSSKGMLEFLTILSGQEFLHTNRQDPYVLTHPLTRGRIRFVRHHVENSPTSAYTVPAAFAETHRRMVAKLNGFIDPPTTTLRRYKEDDGSISSRYARAIAYFRRADLTHGLPLIDSLIAEEPKNPYFHELKAQLMFENGRMDVALDSYKEATRLLPDAPLLRTSLAHVQLETNRQELVPDALRNAKEAIRVDRFVPLAWRLAGVAHGRMGDIGLSSWALAEYNLLIGRKKQAASLAKRAMRLLKKGDPAWIRAQDITQQTDRKG
ncbi:MAG: M48 family metalloprotease [Rhodospirillaceae bacterium]|jgi:predicted Zn-dependent protease|nr:M48 family metalloprotease [Rhodospirillaceae bacterium]MBT5456473.1 M48 family metalloprotease [Rhodospirillaceae bacterium]